MAEQSQLSTSRLSSFKTVCAWWCLIIGLSTRRQVIYLLKDRYHGIRRFPLPPNCIYKQSTCQFTQQVSIAEKKIRAIRCAYALKLTISHAILRRLCVRKLACGLLCLWHISKLTVYIDKLSSSWISFLQTYILLLSINLFLSVWVKCMLTYRTFVC